MQIDAQFKPAPAAAGSFLLDAGSETPHATSRLAAPQRIFEGWSEEHTELWGRHPLRLQHTLHTSPLFSMDGLAELIEHYPRQLYMLVSMGGVEDRKLWREGDIAEMSGKAVIEAIANGRLWLNLRCTDQVDPRYARILAQMFEEIGVHVTHHDDFPGRSFGILISSPGAQVYYHCDLPNQSLWQISGNKRVYVYPPIAPFLRGEDLERIAVYEVEVDIPYRAWYDTYAHVYDLEPGQMLHWPLNSPHRVVNCGNLNVSITTEYWADEAWRRQRVNVANGALRFGLGLAPTGRATHGPGFAAKGLLSRGVARTSWWKKARKAHKPIDFTLDPHRPGEIVDLPASTRSPAAP